MVPGPDGDAEAVVEHLGELVSMDAIEHKANQPCTMLGGWAEDAEALNTLKMEKTFLDDHLLRWMPDFQGAVAHYATHPFYEALVSLTSRVLVLDNEYITGLLSQQGKHKNIHDKPVVSGEV